MDKQTELELPKQTKPTFMRNVERRVKNFGAAALMFGASAFGPMKSATGSGVDNPSNLKAGTPSEVTPTPNDILPGPIHPEEAQNKEIIQDQVRAFRNTVEPTDNKDAIGRAMVNGIPQANENTKDFRTHKTGEGVAKSDEATVAGAENGTNNEVSVRAMRIEVQKPDGTKEIVPGKTLKDYQGSVNVPQVEQMWGVIKGSFPKEMLDFNKWNMLAVLSSDKEDPADALKAQKALFMRLNEAVLDSQGIEHAKNSMMIFPLGSSKEVKGAAYLPPLGQVSPELNKLFADRKISVDDTNKTEYLLSKDGNALVGFVDDKPVVVANISTLVDNINKGNAQNSFYFIPVEAQDNFKPGPDGISVQFTFNGPVPEAVATPKANGKDAASFSVSGSDLVLEAKIAVGKPAEKLSAEFLQKEGMLDGVSFRPIGAESIWRTETNIPGLTFNGTGLEDMQIRLPRLGAQDALDSTKPQVFKFIKQTDGKLIDGSVLRMSGPGGIGLYRQVVITDKDPNETVFNIYINPAKLDEVKKIKSAEGKVLYPNVVINNWLYIALAVKYGGLGPLADKTNVDEIVGKKIFTPEEIKTASWAKPENASISVTYKPQ